MSRGYVPSERLLPSSRDSDATSAVRLHAAVAPSPQSKGKILTMSADTASTYTHTHTHTRTRCTRPLHKERQHLLDFHRLLRRTRMGSEHRVVVGNCTGGVPLDKYNRHFEAHAYCIRNQNCMKYLLRFFLFAQRFFFFFF